MPDYLGGAKIMTRGFRRGKQKKSQRKMQLRGNGPERCKVADFEDGRRGPGAKEHRLPLEAERGKASRLFPKASRNNPSLRTPADLSPGRPCQTLQQNGQL